MSSISLPGGLSIWRAFAICLLGVLIGLAALGPADAGQKRAKVLKPTKTIVAEGEVANAVGADEVVIAKCPKGWQVTGGGYDFQSGDPEVHIAYNGPLVRGDNLVAADPGMNPAAKAWRVRVENDANVTWTFSVAAICSKPIKVLK